MTRALDAHPATLLRRKALTDYDEGLLSIVQQLFDGVLLVPDDWPACAPSREMFLALGELVKKGCLAFLVRMGGWQRLRGCEEKVGGGRILPVSELRIFEGRLWDQPSLLDGRFAVDESVLRFWMEFGEAVGRERDSAESRMSAHQLEEVASRAARSGMAGALSVHVAARRLALLDRAEPLLPLLMSSDRWAAVTLAPAGLAEGEIALAEDWLESFSWTLPWISADLAAWWLRGERSFGKASMAEFERCVTALERALSFFVERAREKQRFDWLSPVMQFFAAAYPHSVDFERRVRDFEASMNEGSQRERQRMRDLWAQLLEIALELGRERDRQYRVHPADRQAPTRLFLDAYVELGFAQRLRDVDVLRKALAGVL